MHSGRRYGCLFEAGGCSLLHAVPHELTDRGRGCILESICCFLLPVVVVVVVVVVIVVVVVVPHKHTGGWEERPSCGRAKSHEANHVHLADVDNDVKIRNGTIITKLSSSSLLLPLQLILLKPANVWGAPLEVEGVTWVGHI